MVEKPHGGRRATQFLCCPVHQRQSVKDASEEVTRVLGVVVRVGLARGWCVSLLTLPCFDTDCTHLRIRSPRFEASSR